MSHPTSPSPSQSPNASSHYDSLDDIFHFPINFDDEANSLPAFGRDFTTLDEQNNSDQAARVDNMTREILAPVSPALQPSSNSLPGELSPLRAPPRNSPRVPHPSPASPIGRLPTALSHASPASQNSTPLSAQNDNSPEASVSHPSVSHSQVGASTPPTVEAPLQETPTQNCPAPPTNAEEAVDGSDDEVSDVWNATGEELNVKYVLQLLEIDPPIHTIIVDDAYDDLFKDIFDYLEEIEDTETLAHFLLLTIEDKRKDSSIGTCSVLGYFLKYCCFTQELNNASPYAIFNFLEALEYLQENDELPEMHPSKLKWPFSNILESLFKSSDGKGVQRLSTSQLMDFVRIAVKLGQCSHYLLTQVDYELRLNKEGKHTIGDLTSQELAQLGYACVTTPFCSSLSDLCLSIEEKFCEKNREGKFFRLKNLSHGDVKHLMEFVKARLKSKPILGYNFHAKKLLRLRKALKEHKPTRA